MIRTAWIALLALALAAPVAAAPAAKFQIEGDRIVISGTFDGDSDFNRLYDLLEANPSVNTIHMKNFFGGTLNAATAPLYPKFIRERRLNTEFDGPCISACSLLFLGGVKRRLAPGADPARSFIGFHGAYSGGGKPVKSFIAVYLDTVKRYTGGKMTGEVAEIVYNLPQDEFLAFFDARRLTGKNKKYTAALCGTQNHTLSCQGIDDLDGYRLGILTP
jgi:hypothetical protein